MGLRILVGIIALGFALQMTRNIYRDMKRTESGNESRYLYGMKVDLWKDPLRKGPRVIFALVAVPLNVFLYIFAIVAFFNIDLSTVLPFLGKK